MTMKVVVLKSLKETREGSKTSRAVDGGPRGVR